MLHHDARCRAVVLRFPLQLMDEGPPAPLYAELFRSAALLRRHLSGRAPTRALQQLAGTYLWRSGAATLAPKLEAWLSARWHHRLIRFRNL